LKTERLLLRPFDQTDGHHVQKLAGDIKVAATTALIPHPYEDGMAEDWIATHEANWNLGRGLVLAMTVPPDNSIIGAIGFTIAPEHNMAELGYWVGVPFWGKGYCTEAARALVDFGFSDLALNRIHAHHFGNNPASGRVLQKVGMKFEGCSRHAFMKWGEYLDIHRYGILRSDWDAGPKPDVGD
jgi:ribosomal-protein-alanine N-acetyltransferase